jgi:hypothetical protein
MRRSKSLRIADMVAGLFDRKVVKLLSMLGDWPARRAGRVAVS